MPYLFNSDPCLSAPFKLNWRPPYSKVFFIYTHLILISLYNCTPSELRNSVSSLPCQLWDFYCHFYAYVFSTVMEWDPRETRTHLCPLYSTPESSAAPAVNAQSGGIKQWGRKRLIYILIFVAFCQAWILCYQINFYLIYWCFSDSLSNVNAYTNTYTTWMDVRIGEQWTKVRILSK